MFNSIRAYGRNLAVAAGVALLATAAVPQLKASEMDKKVTMTFSAPVEIPGNRVLPAGTYVFKTAPGNPGVIIIMNGEENRPIGMTMTIPEIRTTVPEKVHVRFDERPTGAPQAMKSWTYPGNDTGFEFVYPEGAGFNTSKPGF